MGRKCTWLMVLLGVVLFVAGTVQAQLITGVERRGSTFAPPQVAPDPLADNSPCYVDRVHQYTDIPEFLLGAEYVMVANDDKNPATYELDVTLSGNAILYLILDNRLGGGSMTAPGPVGNPMPWVLEMGFVNLEVDLGIDEGADGTINQRSTIWALEVKRGTITLFAQNDGGSRNMYGVAALPSTPAGVASAPAPEDEADDVPREVVLSWTAGEFAATHDVYLGTAFDDVNDASRADPRGVLVSQGQTATSYDPPDLLEFGATYYWRIDEVNAAPDNTIFKGTVWSFATEPFAYAIQNVIATASSSSADTAPANTVDGSGLNEDDQHSTAASDMWLTAADAELPIWIQYEFDRVYKMHELLVWNYNVQFEPVLGFGAKDVTVEYSVDGAEWAVLGDVEFARAAATASYVANTAVDMAGVGARYVRLVIQNNWGVLPQIGLSEVRFLYIPAQAREPQPASGGTDASVDSVLTWRAGRDAVSHEVYFGTDADELPLAGSPAQAAFAASLEFGTTYYWQVDEVGDDAVWPGELWSFATQEYRLIDGFETYTDDIDAGEAIFDTWLDGWVNSTGSTVGHLETPFAERTIVHSGSQSMPLQYDNTVSPFYSEAERTFASPQNWTGNGADTLVVYFQGLPASFLELADGKIILGAAGADIWGTADEFRFAYKNLNGDGSLIAYVESVSRANEWTKAGVMIRETLQPGSKFAAVYSTPDYGCRYQARLTMGVDAVSDSSIATAEQIALRAPHWVKIERVGNAFNGYYSTDGENWTAMAWNPQTIVMGANAYIGLALTSHVTGVLASAEFSGMTTTGNVSGQWTVETIGPAQPEGNSAAPLYVRVEDATGKAASVTHPAGNGAVFLAGWNEWQIPLSEFAGVNLSRVDTMTIGVGNRTSPAAGGTGIVYIDDIGFGRPAAQ
ncbi:discoidin domain-containing protein [Anaerobaca lacustris]|uniref:Discoidin domain-containing protein n=1 Tax=Anaerobaca lacustris TaxID=3044600 RepID=A0AAW6U1A6_9BACT|nr:discoidin domain-containing protein [Sedimentisphaerales bacterium M17dextr]